MKKHEWKERTADGGTRRWRATLYGKQWTVRSWTSDDEEWIEPDPVPAEAWLALRDILWRKYQRRRVAWEEVAQIDEIIAEAAQSSDEPEGRSSP